MKTAKDFKSMVKNEVVEYTLKLQEEFEEFKANKEDIEDVKAQLELTQEEAAHMSETIRMKNVEKNVTSEAIANLINGLNLAIGNAQTLLETLGIISKGGK